MFILPKAWRCSVIRHCFRILGDVLLSGIVFVYRRWEKNLSHSVCGFAVNVYALAVFYALVNTIFSKVIQKLEMGHN